MSKIILKRLIIILILAFPLGELARFDLGNAVFITVNDLLIGVVVGTFVVTHVIQKTQINNYLLKPFLLFCLVAFISLLINSLISLNISQFTVAFLYLIRFIVYTSIYFVVAEFDNVFKKSLSVYLVIMGFLVVVGGYIQYFFYPSLRNLYYLGWDEHLYRMFSSFLDPNFAGTFFVLYLIFIIGLLQYKIKNSKKQEMIFLIITGILTTGAIFLTYSRAAYVMLFISIIIFFILQKKTRFILGIIILFAILIVGVSLIFKSEGTNLLRTSSTFARLDSAERAIFIIEKNPILGIGFNAYRYAQQRYGFLIDKNAMNHAGAGTDNSFLFVLATTGIMGFLSYMYFWFTLLKKQTSRFRNSTNRFYTKFSLIVLCSIAGLFVNALFLNSLFYIFILEWVWIVIGVSTENT